MHTMLRGIALIFCIFLTSCTPKPEPVADSHAALEKLEMESGGRLGVALVDGSGQRLLSYRADERFAMCSTFKLLLAAQILDGSARGKWSLDDAMPFDEGDLLGYAPYTKQHIGKGYLLVGPAAEHSVTLSDNSAANLLLDLVGGPDAFTAWLRGRGDAVTRLDRTEPALNENIPNDPRDTSSPAAMARSVHRFALGDGLQEPERAMLSAWAIASETGLDRIRAGLPHGWRVGNKTGTCGYVDGAVNDVAIFRDGDGPTYVLAVFLDSPTTHPEISNRIIADVARWAVARID